MADREQAVYSELVAETVWATSSEEENVVLVPKEAMPALGECFDS